MSRIRSLHPSQWTDGVFARCTPTARLLLLGLRNEADDHGVFEWDPLSLKLRLLPLDEVDIGELLAELVGRGLVASYEVNGERYGVCLLWNQQPQHPSYRYPQPPVDKAPEPSGALHAPHEPSIPLTSLHPDSYLESKSREEERGTPAPAGAALSLDFDLPKDWEEEVFAARQSVGLAEVNLAAEWVKFRHHNAGKRRRDGRRRWLNWALNAHARPGNGVATSGHDAAPAAETSGADPGRSGTAPVDVIQRPHNWQEFPQKWRARAIQWVLYGHWPGSAGPPPGAAGCEMPEALAIWAKEERAKRLGDPRAEPREAVAGNGAAPPATSSRRKPGPSRQQPEILLPFAGGADPAETLKHKPRRGDRDPRTAPEPGKPWPGDSWEEKPPPAREAG